MREPRESLMEFATRLNGLSRDCDFDNYSRDDAHLEVILKVALYGKFFPRNSNTF